MRIKEKDLREAAIRILKSFGATKEEAAIVAENLVVAEMRGISTHGIKYLPIIIERIKNKLIDVPTKMKVIKNSGAIIHMDGGNGLGQYAAKKSMEQAIKKAKRFGIGFVLTKNTNHIGILSYYSSLAAYEGMIGLCMSNSAPAIAPWGGVEPFFGTNPFSIALPRKNNSPVVLDMSISVVSRGRIRYAEKAKEKIPLGWAMDNEGNPTQDPAKALEGSLIPIGGPKGYGMALFIDIICGLLSGSSYAKKVKTFHKLLGPTGIGIVTAALDISRFMSVEQFVELLEEYILQIKSSKKAKGNEIIYIPGEIEWNKQVYSRTYGVNVDPTILHSINVLLKESNLEEIREENNL